jgi:hypothetical protein
MFIDLADVVKLHVFKTANHSLIYRRFNQKNVAKIYLNHFLTLSLKNFFSFIVGIQELPTKCKNRSAN